MRHADGGVQHAQVIVDLRDRAHGRPRAAAGGLLLDRNRRAQPVDRVHLGPLHLVQELARVGRQRFHIAPLSLRVDRVEGQRRLAGAAQPRDHGEGIARDLDVDILQVVLPCPMHGNLLEQNVSSLVGCVSIVPDTGNRTPPALANADLGGFRFAILAAIPAVVVAVRTPGGNGEF